MDNKGKKLIKTTMLFSVGNIGAKLLMLIIVPLYTYYVAVEQMGRFDIINTYVNLLTPLICLALHEGIYRWLLDKDSMNEHVLRTGLNLSFLLLIVFDIVAVVTLKLIHFEYIVEFIVLVDSSALYMLSQYITRGLKNNKIYAVQGIVYSIVLIITQVVLVFWKDMQARGLMISMAVAFFVTTLFMFVFQRIFRKYFCEGSFDKELSIKLVKYSLPMVPNNVAWWLVAAASRIIINKAMGDAANGIYAIALKFPTLVAVVSTLFYQAWQEQAITEYNNEKRDEYYTKVFSVFSKILFTSVIALMPITKIIMTYFMDSDYQSAFNYVGYLYLASVFNAFAAFYGTGYLSVKKTGPLIMTTLAGAAANILIAVITIRFFGLYAAAIGNMIGYAVIWLIRVNQTKRIFTIKINKISMSMFVILMLAVVNIIVLVNSIYLLITFELVTIIIFILVNKELLIGLLKTLKTISKR